MTEAPKPTSRRAEALTGVPKTVPIPKFFSPSDIRRVIDIKLRKPYMTWDQVVKHVVTEGVRK